MSAGPEHSAPAGFREVDDHVAQRVLLVADPEGADTLASFHFDLVEVIAEVSLPGGERDAGLVRVRRPPVDFIRRSPSG